MSSRVGQVGRTRLARAATGTLLVGCLLAVAVSAEAQEDCEFLPGTSHVSGETIWDGSRITHIRTPRLACRDGMRVSADSAVFFESTGLYQLFGRTVFENPEVRLQSRDAQYYNRQGRITAQGAVRLLRKEDGAVVTGENLEYLEAGPGRPQTQLTVTGGRPRATLQPRREGGAAASPAEPYEVEADRIVVPGNNDFRATGRVEVRKGEMQGYGQQVDYFGTQGQLALRGGSRLEAERFELTGGLILLLMPDDELREVMARDGSRLVGERLTLDAPMIRIHLDGDGGLDRLVAGRPEDGQVAVAVAVGEEEGQPAPTIPRNALALAVTEDFSISGDSLEVEAPGEILERVTAMGRAHAVSSAGGREERDDMPEIARRDWIEGDTIVAVFAPAAPTLASAAPAQSGDEEVALELLVARGAARALYRMAAADTTGAAAPEERRLAVSYVTGDVITIHLLDGEVQEMDVEGQTRGIHFEPQAPRGQSGSPEGTAAAGLRERGSPEPTPPQPSAPPGRRR